MADIEFNPVELSNINNEMNYLVDATRYKAEQMMASVDRLTGMWTGPAHEAFYKEFLNSKEAMDSYIDVCETISQCLNNAITQYYEAEEAISDAVSSISG